MKVILAQPRGFLRRRRARHRDRRTRAGEIRPAGLCPPRDRAQQACGRDASRPRARASSRNWTKCRRRRRDGVQRPWRRQAASRTDAAARPAGARRDLPAGLQGPQPGQALCRPGPHADPDRPCRPSRGRRHHGPGRRAGAPGADREPTSHRSTSRPTRRSPISPRPRSASTTPRGIIAALQERFTDIVGPGDARHLLRHAEPPDGGARTGQAGRRDPGGRREEQLQFQPAARDRRRGRHAELSDRRRQRSCSRNGFAASKIVGLTAGASAPGRTGART